MAKNISLNCKIVFLFFTFLFIVSCKNISQVSRVVEAKKEIKNKQQRVKSLQMNENNLFNYSISNQDDEDKASIINYKYDENNCTVIEEGFFDHVFENLSDENFEDFNIICNSEVDNCEDIEQQIVHNEEDNSSNTENNLNENETNKNGDENDNNQGKNSEETNKNIENEKKMKLDLPSLKKYFKLKERDRNICHINERFTITPKLTIVTNKKRTYTFNFSYMF